jgi:hypothetical protein
MCGIEIDWWRDHLLAQVFRGHLDDSEWSGRLWLDSCLQLERGAFPSTLIPLPKSVQASLPLANMLVVELLGTGNPPL